MNALIVNCSPVRTGATAEITRIVSEQLSVYYNTRTVCIDDYSFEFCKGCRICYSTAECILRDDVDDLMNEFEWADRIVCVSPSYWADIPGQFKSFIDRCTPWCNTHEPHKRISLGKEGYVIALRTGSAMKECERIISSIEHFYGHLEIACSGSLRLCSIESKESVAVRRGEIDTFCKKINRMASFH